MGLEEQKECIDPKYQRDKGVDTYYPQGTLCFKDPSAGIIVFNAFWLLNLDVKYLYLYHLRQSLVKYSTFLIFSMSMVLFWIVQFIHQTKAASPTHNKSLLYIVYFFRILSGFWIFRVWYCQGLGEEKWQEKFHSW